jgi:hypothetical protein
MLENPELLRYMRSELRPARAMAITGGVVTGVILLALIAYSRSLRGDTYILDYPTFWKSLEASLLTLSACVLLLWSVLACAYSVVGERSHRTFDFWRITRLEPSTLTLGKVFGPSLGAWLQYAAVLPVLVIAAIGGNGSVKVLLSSYLVIALTAVAYSFIAVCFSSRAREARRAQAVIFLLLLPLIIPAFTLGAHRPYAGFDRLSAWDAIVPFTAIGNWFFGTVERVSVFGYSVPSLVVSVVVAVVAIGFCFAALRNAIKYEPEQRSLFTPAQAVALTAFMQLFTYAAFIAGGTVVYVTDGSAAQQIQQHVEQGSLDRMMTTGIILNIATIVLVIVLTVVSRESLRNLLRNHTSRQVVSKIMAPWIAVAAIGVVAFVSAVLGHVKTWGYPQVPWTSVACLSAALFVYAIADGLFLQWIASTRTKAPVVKGLLILWCYHIFCAALAGGAQRFGNHVPAHVLRWLTPAVVGTGLAPSIEVLYALVPPALVAAFFARSVVQRVSRPAKALHVTAAA